MHLVSALGLLVCVIVLKSSDMTVSSGVIITTPAKKEVTGTAERVETTAAERATTRRGPVDLGEQTKAAATTAGKEATTAARSDERTTRAGPQNIEETREPVSGAAVPEGDKVLISCPDLSIERLDNGTCFSPNAPIDRNNVFCPFVDQEGCLRSEHPANHCSGCFQEKDLCDDGVERKCNQACIERGYAKGVCENVADKRCPCLLVGYRACYCYKRSLEGEHTTQGPK